MLKYFTGSQNETVRAQPKKHAGVVIACCSDRSMLHWWNIWRLAKIHEIVKTSKYPKRCTNLHGSSSYCVPTMSKIMPFLFNSKPPHLQRCWRINQIRGSAVRIGASHWNLSSLRNLHFHFSIFFTVPFFPIRFVLFQRPCFNPFSKKKGMFHCTSHAYMQRIL